MTQPPAIVKPVPSVIKWLRESSGWSLEDVSKHLNISVELVEKWERGERYPTVNQIKELSKSFKRPFSAFLLPEPQVDRPLPQDLRRLPGGHQPFSKETVRMIRKAQYLQQVTAELMDNIGYPTEPETAVYSISDSPEEAAQLERKNVQLIRVNPKRGLSAHEAFRIWREYIEEKNVCVFQLRTDIAELRGFCLTDILPNIIVVNSSDAIQARIFTLLHEYGHILLREAAFCTPDNPIKGNSQGARIEQWCNHFAGAFLMPKEEIKEIFKLGGIEKIPQMARKYSVSHLAMLTRLRVLRQISEDTYRKERTKFQLNDTTPKKSGGGGETSVNRAHRERGDLYVSLVVSNARSGHISHYKALDYLDIKMKDYQTIIRSS